jgi:hypothetical protein
MPVDHRFENHKAGYKSAWVVEKYGVRLMPELYEHLNPMPFEAAVQMETDLADELRTAEYTVKSEPVSSQKLDHAPETRVGIVIMTTGLTASGIINPGADPVMPT